MQVQIDVNLLVENGISADDFLALYAIYRKGFKTLDKCREAHYTPRVYRFIF